MTESNPKPVHGEPRFAELQRPYRGRFAPSPTGPLHAGSLAAALASWLDARAASGAWLVRIEDIDAPRNVPGMAAQILRTLDRFGLHPDEPALVQSTRGASYEAALQELTARGLIYGCACSRRDIDLAGQAGGRPAGAYPGTCRGGTAGRPVRALRVRVPTQEIGLCDRWAGWFAQSLPAAVGDFVVRRADGQWAYQLAVVVDDAAQGITHVVRGADLLDNTPRQIFLQRALQLPTPAYLHLPLVINAQGEKLSKQTGATPLDETAVKDELQRALLHLGLPDLGAESATVLVRLAIDHWRERLAGRPTIDRVEKPDG